MEINKNFIPIKKMILDHLKKIISKNKKSTLKYHINFNTNYLLGFKIEKNKILTICQCDGGMQADYIVDYPESEWSFDFCLNIIKVLNLSKKDFN